MRITTYAIVRRYPPARPTPCSPRPGRGPLAVLAGGTGGGGGSEMETHGSVGSIQEHERPSPAVALLHDEAVRSKHLRQALDIHSCRVMDVFPNTTLEEVHALRSTTDLLIIPVDARRPETLSRLRSLARLNGTASILALARPQDVAKCLEALRRTGIAGLLATDASQAHVEFRLNEVLDLFPERRRCVRVPVVLPAEVTTPDGSRSWEYAISLSIAGLGLASRRALPANSDLEVRLRLAGASAPVRLPGRVIHCVEETGSIPPFRIGVYFREPAERTIRQIEAVVAAAV